METAIFDAARAAPPPPSIPLTSSDTRQHSAAANSFRSLARSVVVVDGSLNCDRGRRSLFHPAAAAAAAAPLSLWHCGSAADTAEKESAVVSMSSCMRRNISGAALFGDVIFSIFISPRVGGAARRGGAVVVAQARGSGGGYIEDQSGLRHDGS